MTRPKSIRIMDSTLRDGSHAKAHQFTAEQVGKVVGALDAAGVPVIEVSHGDGLGVAPWCSYRSSQATCSFAYRPASGFGSWNIPACFV